MTFLSNLDVQATDKLKLGLNLFGSRGVKNGVTTQSDGSVTAGGGVISLAMRFALDKPIKDENNNFTTNDVIGDEVDNPYAVATERIDETKKDKFRTNFYANYDIMKDLPFKTTFGYSTINTMRGIYQPSTLQITASGVGGRGSIQQDKTTNFLSESYLTYKKTMDDMKFSFLGGYSYQGIVNEGFFAEATGFTSDSFSYRNLGNATTRIESTSYLRETKIESQFGRLNLDYDDKYLLTATVRRDGASNFSENNKYAIFPSAALGWKVSMKVF